MPSETTLLCAGSEMSGTALACPFVCLSSTAWCLLCPDRHLPIHVSHLLAGHHLGLGYLDGLLGTGEIPPLFLFQVCSFIQSLPLHASVRFMRAGGSAISFTVACQFGGLVWAWELEGFYMLRCR